MSIQSEIDRINQAKTDLATAIESKGVTVPPNTTINVYPGLVQQIEQGAGLPSGGTPGQMLYQGESGAEWGDKPIFRAMLTMGPSDESEVFTVTCDKTPLEIAQAYDKGFEIQIALEGDGTLIQCHLYTIGYSGNKAGLMCTCQVEPSAWYYIEGSQSPEDGVKWEVTFGTGRAQITSFTPGTTGLTATNVQDAIEEVNTKATRTAIPISIPTTGWADNKQTFTVTGIPSDPTTYEVHLSQVGATNVSAAIACGLYIADEAANSLTLAVNSVPEAAFQVYAVVQGVSV